MQFNQPSSKSYNMSLNGKVALVLLALSASSGVDALPRPGSADLYGNGAVPYSDPFAGPATSYQRNGGSNWGNPFASFRSALPTWPYSRPSISTTSKDGILSVKYRGQKPDLSLSFDCGYWNKRPMFSISTTLTYDHECLANHPRKPDWVPPYNAHAGADQSNQGQDGPYGSGPLLTRSNRISPGNRFADSQNLIDHGHSSNPSFDEASLSDWSNPSSYSGSLSGSGHRPLVKRHFDDQHKLQGRGLFDWFDQHHDDEKMEDKEHEQHEKQEDLQHDEDKKKEVEALFDKRDSHLAKRAVDVNLDLQINGAKSGSSSDSSSSPPTISESSNSGIENNGGTNDGSFTNNNNINASGSSGSSSSGSSAPDSSSTDSSQSGSSQSDPSQMDPSQTSGQSSTSPTDPSVSSQFGSSSSYSSMTGQSSPSTPGSSSQMPDPSQSDLSQSGSYNDPNASGDFGSGSDSAASANGYGAQGTAEGSSSGPNPVDLTSAAGEYGPSGGAGSSDGTGAGVSYQSGGSSGSSGSSDRSGTYDQSGSSSGASGSYEQSGNSYGNSGVNAAAANNVGSGNYGNTYNAAADTSASASGGASSDPNINTYAAQAATNGSSA